jgi:hypothetical protein
MSQIIERFEAAVQALVADGPVKERLARAYIEFLEDLQEVELPTGNTAFGALHTALHRIPPVGREGWVRASVQKMSPTEAGRHARTIVGLYQQLLEAPRLAEPLKVVESGAVEAPEFLLSAR